MIKQKKNSLSGQMFYLWSKSRPQLLFQGGLVQQHLMKCIVFVTTDIVWWCPCKQGMTRTAIIPADNNQNPVTVLGGGDNVITAADCFEMNCALNEYMFAHLSYDMGCRYSSELLTQGCRLYLKGLESYRDHNPALIGTLLLNIVLNYQLLTKMRVFRCFL